MTTNRLLSSGLLLLALTPPAAAQYYPPYVTAIPGTDLPGQPWFQQAVVGDFTGDLRRSAIALRVNGTTSQLIHAFEPGRYQSIVRLPEPTDVTGIVAFERRSPAISPPGSPPPIEPDVLFVTTTTGPRVGIFNDVLGEFVFSALAGFPPTWNGATGLVAARQGNSVRIAARGSDGLTALLARRDSLGSITPTLEVPIGIPIHYLQLLDWDNDGMIELVTTTTGGIGVSELNSTAASEFHPFPYNNIAGTRTRCDSLPSLAFVTPDLAPPMKAVIGNPTLTELIALPSAMLPANHLPVSLSAFDLGADGTDELLLMVRGSFEALKISPRPQGLEPVLEWITLDATLVPGPGLTPEANSCPLIWDDLDYDGLPDALQFMDSPGPQMLMRPRAVVCGTTVPAPLPHLTSEIISDAIYDVLPGSPTYRHLKLSINRNKAPTAGRCDIKVWHQPNPNNQPTGVPPMTLVPSLCSTFVWPASGANLEVDLPMACVTETDPYWSNYDHYYLDIRLLDLNLGKVMYSEIDGLTVAAVDPGENEYPSNLDDYLESLVPSYEVRVRVGILRPEFTTSIPLGRVPIGGIIVRIRPPKTDAGG
jgi:hypothetical protein